MPLESSVENPIDVLGDAMEDRYENVIDSIVKIKGIGAVLCIVTPQAQTPIKNISMHIIRRDRLLHR